jgi:hypothetical protein
MRNKNKHQVVTSGNYTVTFDEVVVVNKTTGAATAITIPAAASSERPSLTIIDGKGDANTNNITVTPVSGTINGAASLVLKDNYGAVTLLDNGTEWVVLSRGYSGNVTPGTVVAGQPLVANSSKDLASLRDVTLRDTITTSGVGAAAGTGVSAVEYGNGAMHKTVLTVAALPITVTDTGGAGGGQGSQKVYDFPEGPIQLIGSSYNLTTARSSTGIAATAALVGSLGSVAADNANATLTSTEADMIASTAGPLTAGAGSLKSHGSLVATAFDGHTTALDAILNLAVPDANISATDTITLNGTITLTWANLGDY